MAWSPSRADFTDDLESFFWVYAWMMTVHDGPGAKRLVPESERTESAINHWEKSEELDHTFIHLGWKDYLQAFAEEDYCKFTPYFSKSVYLTLIHSFRKLLYGYWHQKDKRPKDDQGNRAELDFFSEIDDIYSKVLGFFDVAIKSFSPASKPPPRIQPDRQAKRRRDEGSINPSLPKRRKQELTELFVRSDSAERTPLLRLSRSPKERVSIHYAPLYLRRTQYKSLSLPMSADPSV